ncbi:Aryl-alcohol dehydrogenase related enzyme [Liquorilactobacillus vini DSM 20605]|uniref:Aryl-alcohol dehydrogenase related enzyme n=1 Tax=Liquorilactobacillus vini DSM 20605 TaxID=1133569 RepID=A0A0R2CM54_9LACO|nr:Aryl-alcohol dehydrogenase related enzyme [Liquorilactobacillus vini DSM 20605]
MNTIKVGQSEVLTTQLGLGTNKVGGHNLFPNLQDQDGYAVVKTALDNGVQMLDTAFMYGLGRSEEIIGDVLQDYRREQVVIATKAAQDQSRNLKPNNQPAFLKKAVDDALKRLKTDYIDIFYIHFPDEKTPKAEAVAALTELKKAGKIKAVGVSNFSLAQIKAANQDGGVDIVEDHYSLVHRQAEKELLPYLTKNKITFVPYFPLASGLLTGKYNQSDSGKFTQFTSQQFQQIIDNLKFIRQIAEKHQATVAQVILAWYLKNPAIGIVIPGARKPDQVLSNAKAATIELSMEEFDQIDKLFQGF